MKQKKAQIQNMETITVVIIIIILIIFGIVYAGKQRGLAIEREKQATENLRAMEIVTSTLNLDFLKCSQGGTTQSACVDYYKILALSEHALKSENQMHFFQLLGNSDINVTIHRNISSSDENQVIIQLFESINTENLSAIRISTPIIVRDPITRMNYFGLMEVVTYT